MASTLSRIPIASRRRLAATVGLFATLFIAVGAVASTGPSSGGVRAFSVIAFVVAAILALTGWGVLRSVRIDVGERRLDEAIAASVAALGRDGVPCGCGHDHDANEMHVSDSGAASTATECGQDGHGDRCAHTCEVCVLSAMRPKEAAYVRETEDVRLTQPAADEAAIRNMRPSPTATRTARASGA